MKKSQLEKFITIRNKTEYHSNLAFTMDLDACGIEIDELGVAEKYFENDKLVGYKWDTPYGTLIERYGKMSLE